MEEKFWKAWGKEWKFKWYQLERKWEIMQITGFEMENVNGIEKLFLGCGNFFASFLGPFWLGMKIWKENPEKKCRIFQKIGIQTVGSSIVYFPVFIHEFL